MKFTGRFLVATLLALPSASWALECTTSIVGKQVKINYEKDQEFRSRAGIRDRVVSNWRHLCPGYAVLRHMTPNLTNKQRELFCLNYDEKTRGYIGLSRGERDGYWQCTSPNSLCESINTSKEEAMAIAGALAGTAAGATAVSTGAGISAVAHSSGAMILTGSAGYMAGTLGSASATLLGVLTAPATASAAVITIAAFGSAVYVCSSPGK